MLSVFNSFVEHYQTTQEQDTGALALQTFEKLQQLKVRPTPIHYTLLFEYFAQIDPEFASQIENAIQLGHYNDVTAEILFFDLISTIFKKHLPSDAFSKILKDLLVSLNHWEKNAQQNQKQLKENQEILCQLESSQQIRAHMQSKMLPTVEHIISQNAELKADVAETQQKIRELQQELNNAIQLAKTDELTGLLNRRGFNQAFEEIIQQAQQEQNTFCLLILDLDFFKRINDNHGHLVGDAVLRYLARLLLNEIKGKDVVARIGGEEFGILLPETCFSDAVKLAETLRKKVTSNMLKDRTNHSSIQVSISIGVGIYQMGEPMEKLIERADKALYQAKNRGRNRVCTEADH